VLPTKPIGSATKHTKNHWNNCTTKIKLTSGDHQLTLKKERKQDQQKRPIGMRANEDLQSQNLILLSFRKAFKCLTQNVVYMPKMLTND